MGLYITSVSIENFRGFRDRQTIPLSVGKRPLSVSLFGDNGSGKSSLADAFEFFFTRDGIIQRLGQRETENQAGGAAMVHVEAGTPGKVTVAFSDGSEATRRVSGGKPGALDPKMQSLLDLFPAPVLLRATDMKVFVADRKGTDRYEEFARWMGLERMTELYNDLTKVERDLGKHDRTSERAERLRELQRTTGLSSWHEPQVVNWINDSLLPKDERDLRIKSLTQLQQLEKKLAARVKGQPDAPDSDAYRRVAQMLGDHGIPRAFSDLSQRNVEVKEAKYSFPEMGVHALSS